MARKSNFHSIGILFVSLTLSQSLFGAPTAPTSPSTWLGKQIANTRIRIGTNVNLPVGDAGTISLRYDYSYIGKIKNAEGKLIGYERKDIYRLALSGNIIQILNTLGVAANVAPLYVGISKELSLSVRRVFFNYGQAMTSLPRNPFTYFPFSADQVDQFPAFTRVTLASAPTIYGGVGWRPELPFEIPLTEINVGANAGVPLSARYVVTVEKNGNGEIQVTTGLTKEHSVALSVSAGLRSRAVEETSGIKQTKAIDRKVRLSVLDLGHGLLPTQGVTAFSKYLVNLHTQPAASDSARKALNEILHAALYFGAESAFLRVDHTSAKGSITARKVLDSITPLAESASSQQANLAKPGIKKDLSAFGFFDEEESRARGNILLAGIGLSSRQNFREFNFRDTSVNQPVHGAISIQQRTWEHEYSLLFGIYSWEAKQSLQGTTTIDPRTDRRILKDMRVLVDAPQAALDATALAALRDRTLALLGNRSFQALSTSWGDLQKYLTSSGKTTINLRNFHLESAFTAEGLDQLTLALNHGANLMTQGDMQRFYVLSMHQYQEWLKKNGVSVSVDRAKIAQELMAINSVAANNDERQKKINRFFDLIQGGTGFGRVWIGYFMFVIDHYTPASVPAQNVQLNRLVQLKWIMEADKAFSSEKELSTLEHARFYQFSRKALDAMIAGRYMRDQGNLDLGTISIGTDDDWLDGTNPDNIPRALPATEGIQ